MNKTGDIQRTKFMRETKEMLKSLYDNSKGVIKIPDKDGTGPRARSPRAKGKKKGMQLGNC